VKSLAIWSKNGFERYENQGEPGNLADRPARGDLPQVREQADRVTLHEQLGSLL